MFLLICIAFLSGLFGIAFPPFWIITALCVRAIVRAGRRNHLEAHHAAVDARTQAYLGWAK